MVENLKFIDLFAGIGGIRLGFEEHFGNCVFSSEWDKFAQQTYKENFKHTPTGDITKIHETMIPEFDILLAGFPCQPFSNAGLKKGFEDSRGTLFFDVARIVNHHKPKVVFLENVKGFKSHNKGQTFATVKRILEEMGYKIYSKVLNARDFGVPQNRERIYIIGFLDDVDFKFPEPINKTVKVGKILDKKVEDPRYFISQRYLDTLKRHRERHKQKGNGFGYEILDPEGVANALVVGGMGLERNLLQVKDNFPQSKNKDGVRKLTPRECARLQGFPETFKIPVSDTQAYKQFGNSVCVPVINAIASSIKLALLNLNKESSVVEFDEVGHGGE